MALKATVYTGLACTWCDRVKSLLKDNDYEVKDIMINANIIEELNEKYDKKIRTVPQVIIEDELIGGYHEVEALMKGPTSINKV